MPIGTGIVYNTGDLILSQVSSSGTAFLETKIAAATSSLIYFDSTARINSASLNSITVGTASYVSGSNSIVTNFTASNISASGTSSFGYVGIGTTSPIQKLDVRGDVYFTGSTLLNLTSRLSNGNAADPLQVNSSILLGGAGGTYTFGKLSYDTSNNTFNVIANANPANLGVDSSIVIKSGTSGGGGPNEIARFVGNGNVGIGTINPAYLLDVSGSTRHGYRAADNHYFTGSVNISGSLTLNGTFAPTSISASGTSSFGYVGIGTTSAVQDRLTVYNSSAATDYTASTFSGGTGYFDNKGGISIYNPNTTANNFSALDFYIDQTNYSNVGAARIICKTGARSTGGTFDTSLIFLTHNQGGTWNQTVIDNSGNVGIGTSSPAQKLSVNNGSTGGSGAVYPIRLSGGTMSSANDATGIQFVQRDANNDYGGYIRLLTTQGSPFYLNPRLEFGVQDTDTNVLGSVTTKMVITGDGNVGIGTTSPVNKLQVAGNISGSSFTSSISNAVGFLGTSSWAQNVVSASFATTAQTANALNASNTYTVAGLTSAYVDVTGAGTIPTTGIYRPSTKTLGLSADGTLIFKISNVSSPATSSIETGNFIVSGSVGIGTTNPTGTYGKLTVAGGIRTLDDNNSKLELGRYSAGASNSYIKLGTNSNALHFTNAADNADIFTILNGGNVGIGTNSPAYTLEVASGTSGQQSLVNFRTADSTTANNAGIQIFATPSATATSREAVMALDADGANASGGDYFLIKKRGNSGTTDFEQYSNASMRFGTNFISRATYDMTIANDGNVGIGTTSPGAKLDVNGDVYISPNTAGKNTFILSTNASNDARLLMKSDTTTKVDIQANGTSYFNGGNVIIGNTTAYAGLTISDITANDTNDSLAFFYRGTSGNHESLIRFYDFRGQLNASFGNNLQDDGLGIQKADLVFKTAFNANPTERMRITNTGNVGIGTTSPGAKLEISGSSNSALLNIKSPISGAIVYVSGSGAVGINTSNIGAYTLQVNGSFAATTKSFVIDHPTKAGKRLIYGSLESPYHGIRLTGRDTIKDGKCKVELPDYMYKLILHDSINIQLTGIKCNKTLYVDEINIPENYFTIAYDKGVFESYKDYDFFWDFTAIRADVPELNTEL